MRHVDSTGVLKAATHLCWWAFCIVDGASVEVSMEKQAQDRSCEEVKTVEGGSESVLVNPRAWEQSAI